MADEIRELARLVASFDRRLRACESGQRAPFTSVKGGYLRWIAESATSVEENPKLYIGKTDDDGVALVLNDTDGGPGEVFIGTNGGVADFIVAGPDGIGAPAAFRVFDGVTLSPLIACAWQHDTTQTVGVNGRSVTTSGTYTRLLSAYLPVQTGMIRSSLIVSLGAGVTSVAVRIRATLVEGGTAGGAQTVHEETGITVPVFLTGLPWTIPDAVISPAASPIGTLVLLEVEARVTGGAGDLLLGATTPVHNATG